jgi:hypothetical protein
VTTIVEPCLGDLADHVLAPLRVCDGVQRPARADDQLERRGPFRDLCEHRAELVGLRRSRHPAVGQGDSPPQGPLAVPADPNGTFACAAHGSMTCPSMS